MRPPVVKGVDEKIFASQTTSLPWVIPLWPFDLLMTGLVSKVQVLGQKPCTKHLCIGGLAFRSCQSLTLYNPDGKQ